MTLARTYKRRVAAGRRRRPPRKSQRGIGCFDALKKIAKHPLVKQLGKKALTYAPKLCKYGVSKINNKTARNILNSVAAEQLLNNVASYGTNG